MLNKLMKHFKSEFDVWWISAGSINKYFVIACQNWWIVFLLHQWHDLWVWLEYQMCSCAPPYLAGTEWYLHGGSSISFVMSVLLENSSVTSDFFTSRYICFLASDIDIWIWIFWTNKECGRSFELSVICILSNWYKEEIRKVWIRIKNLCNSLITTQS